jgi:hypothetical protein
MLSFFPPKCNRWYQKVEIARNPATLVTVRDRKTFAISSGSDRLAKIICNSIDS